MYVVYILQSLKSQKYYIGYTADLVRRLIEHNSNNTASLRNKGPFIVVYSEYYQNKIEAAKREKQIKAYKGGNAFKKLLQL